MSVYWNDNYTFLKEIFNHYQEQKIIQNKPSISTIFPVPKKINIKYTLYLNVKNNKYNTLRPQTARKSSLHGFPTIDRTVNGIGAEESL